MPQPQSLLAELRALEARQAQGGLTPAEQARLAELRAVAGPASAPAPARKGFDVNAAAAAIRESIAPPRPRAAETRAPAPPPAADRGLGTPVPLPAPSAAAAPRTPPRQAPALPPEEVAPAPAEDLAPPPGIEVGAPEGYDLATPPPAAPEGVPATQEYDVIPAFDAAPAEWETRAPELPAQWAQDAAGPAWEPEAPEPGGPGGGPEQPWEPTSPRPEQDTASWDLSGGAAPAMVVPDEASPGATAVWSVAQVAATPGPVLPADWAEDVEPAFLDELQLESEGSFAPLDSAPPPLAPAGTWIGEAPEAEPAGGSDLGQPEPAYEPAALEPVPEPVSEPVPEKAAAPEPVEVSDDQIIEVGTDVVEVPEGDDLPTVDAVELVDDAPEPLPEPVPEPAPEPFGAAAAEVAPTTSEALPPLELTPAPESQPGPGGLPAFEVPSPADFVPPEQPPAPEAEQVAAAAPAAPPAEPQRAPAAAAAEPEPIPLEFLTIEEAPLVEAPAPPEPPPPPAPLPARRVLAGVHRVVVHTMEGQVKRGSLADPDLEAGEIVLSPQPSGAPETLPADRVRAIFFMLGAGEKPLPPEGLKVRVTFRDGRQVAGFSPDYDPDATGFFMIPADTRTNTARIWVYRGAVRQVAVN